MKSTKVGEMRQKQNVYLSIRLPDIWEDIEEECGKFGTIVDMKIPRPSSGKIVGGLGKV